MRNPAERYNDAIKNSAAATISGEPEAQLTSPIERLFTDIAAINGLGKIHLVRETRLDRTRPDFSVSSKYPNGMIHHGFIELKAPGAGADPSKWKGRNATQWGKMKTEAEIIIVTNGLEARLFLNGIETGEPAVLPYDSANQWDETPLVSVLRRFLEARPRAIRTVSDLSSRLALRAGDLRDRMKALLTTPGPARSEAIAAHKAWKKYVHPHATEADFCDDVAQVVSYGMTLAALTSDDLPDRLTLRTARDALRHISPVMAAAFSPLIDKPKLLEAAMPEIGALEALINAINRNKVNASADHRGDPWLYFYEDFLGAYDPKARKEAGVYYTPLPVVKAMVNIVDHVLTNVFGRKQGFADPSVITLDPAAGTGTFPLAVVDKAVERSSTGANAQIGGGRAAKSLGSNLYAFELLPGPYSVAHLRLTQRLSSLSGGQVEAAQVLLADTLDSPDQPHEPDLELGDAETLTREQVRVQEVKRKRPITVIIGNPPYRKVKRNDDGRGSGGWVMTGPISDVNPDALFDDILRIANATKGTVFSHISALYNLYVYFWRWAIWKAFEDHGDEPGIVSFITASSWLSGPGFSGLRQIVREICDDAWIVDLGGDNAGNHREENVFAIETPVAIVTLVRRGASDKNVPAHIRYRKVNGTAEEKIAAMTAMAQQEDPLAGEWRDTPMGWTDSFLPPDNNVKWSSMPLITDLFPWQQPGCMLNRTWPIAPAADLLSQRWSRFTSATSNQERQDLFVTADTGRNIDTKVGSMQVLSTLKPGSPHEAIVKYGYRSYDRQNVLYDPRLMALERPSLWNSMSGRQVFLMSALTGSISQGQAMMVSAYVPDKHAFNGRGGKDIIPVWRDAACREPNMTVGLAELLSSRIGIDEFGVEDLAAYVHALTGTSAYQEMFADRLRTPGLRIPITADADLWTEAVTLGRRLISVQTFGERMSEDHQPTPMPDLQWHSPVTTIPDNIRDVRHESESLHIGDGRLDGVPAEVWNYEISGMSVIRKWVGYRTAKGAGRAASSTNPLERIRPISWNDDWHDELVEVVTAVNTTLSLKEEAKSLLHRILYGVTIPAADLTLPHDRERKPPKETAGQLFA
jgi:hypothetical protein